MIGDYTGDLAISIFDRHSQVRRGGQVIRYHTSPTLGNQTVAEHSWGVATICVELWFDCSLELLKAALYHDVHEGWTGDIPHGFKLEDKELRRCLQNLEHNFEVENKLWYELDKEDTRRLELADIFELMWYIREQQALGNHRLDEIFDCGSKIANGLISLEYKSELDMQELLDTKELRRFS